jgi:DNA (cytosine-5)-methyltransferase 1
MRDDGQGRRDIKRPSRPLPGSVGGLWQNQPSWRLTEPWVGVGQLLKWRSALSNLRALSFFSGAMGLDQGLELEGIETILACEVDKASRATIQANKPNLALIGDVWSHDVDTVREAAGLDGQVYPDIVAGGPPCQAFSTAGARRGLSDHRGNVFLHFLEMAVSLNPTYIVLENVRGLLSMGADLSAIKDTVADELGDLTDFTERAGVIRLVTAFLKSHGYEVSFNLYNAANYGSAQIRERVVVIATKAGVRVPYLHPTHDQEARFGLQAWRVLSDVLHGMEDSHTHVNFPEKRLRYFRQLTAGQNWRSLAPEIQKEAMGKSFHLGGGKTGFYRRLSWAKPSPTLVTHPAMPATDLCHPDELRPLSIEEYRRIQDFPDSWILKGSLTEQYRQIGNAVPVSLARAIGRTIVAHHRGESLEPPINFPFSRYKNTSDVEVLALENKLF